MSPRLFLRVAGMEVRRTLTYRFDFWAQAVLGFLAEWALAWFLWHGVFAASGAAEIGGLGRDEAVRYTLLAALAGKLMRGTGLEGAIAQEIYDGSLSRWCVYPVSLYGFKYAQHVGTVLPGMLQLALFGLAWAALAGPAAFDGVTPLSVLLSLLCLAAGHALLFALAWPVQGVAFWAENVWSLLVALRFVAGLLGGQLLPLSVFPAWAQPVLELLPFRFLFSFPVEVLTGRVGPAGCATGLLVALGWWLALRALGAWVWGRGARVYSGAGM